MFQDPHAHGELEEKENIKFMMSFYILVHQHLTWLRRSRVAVALEPTPSRCDPTTMIGWYLLCGAHLEQALLVAVRYSSF